MAGVEDGGIVRRTNSDYNDISGPKLTSRILIRFSQVGQLGPDMANKENAHIYTVYADIIFWLSQACKLQRYK